MPRDGHGPQSCSLRTLAELLHPDPVRLVGEGATTVTSITEDSRRVGAGTLFVARGGEHSDGRKYVSEAERAGAAAILCEIGAGVLFEPRLEVRDIRRAWGLCAQSLYGDPSRQVGAIGITGTNGKTTVASLVVQALEFLGRRVGRLGTLGFFVDGERLGDSLTTPQPDQLAQYFAQCRDLGASHLVLEVSSHALHQDRVAGVRFAVAAFTNLSQDHLDYHGTMEAYGEAKTRLFRNCEPSHRVLNVDDPFGEGLAREFPDAVTVSASARAKATIYALDAHFGTDGLSAQIVVSREKYSLNSRLLGRYNLENLLVAWGILFCLDLRPQEIARALGQASGVPGRMERCDRDGDDVVVVVDYAHTPDALERALSALVELKFSEIVCVFGCGGDRDRTKRAPMGEIAARHSDQAYLTSDNPRSEDPLKIIAEVRQGIAPDASVVVEADRRRAILEAVSNARPGAAILIAGKGHEDYQLIGDQVLSFDDRLVAREALRLRREGHQG